MGKCIEPETRRQSPKTKHASARMKPVMSEELDFTAHTALSSDRLGKIIDDIDDKCKEMRDEQAIPVVKLFPTNVYGDVNPTKSHVENSTTNSSSISANSSTTNTTSCINSCNNNTSSSSPFVTPTSPLSFTSLKESNTSTLHSNQEIVASSNSDISCADVIRARTPIIGCDASNSSNQCAVDTISAVTVRSITGGGNSSGSSSSSSSSNSYSHPADSCRYSYTQHNRDPVSSTIDNKKQSSVGIREIPLEDSSQNTLQNCENGYKKTGGTAVSCTLPSERLSTVDLNSDEDEKCSVQQLSNQDSVRCGDSVPNNCHQQLNQCIQDSSENSGDSSLISASGASGHSKGKNQDIRSHISNTGSLELPLTNGLTRIIESNLASGCDLGPNFLCQNTTTTNTTTTTTTATTPSMSPIDDVTVMVGKNGKLSTVLENIPLLYIPTTKQLVSQDWTSVNTGGVDHGKQKGGEYVPMTCKFQNEDTKSSNCEKDYVEVDQSPRSTSCSLNCVDTSSLSSLSTCTDVACGTSVASGVSDEFSDQSATTGTPVNADTTTTTTSCAISNVSHTGANSPQTSTYDTANSLESCLVEVNLHSRNSYEPTRSQWPPSNSQDQNLFIRDCTKRKSIGLTGFLGRNLFRRNKDTTNIVQGESEPGWKLFGRIPPKESTVKDPWQISDEYHAKQKASQMVAARARKDIEVMSTTALILENRPGHLPSKAPEEERKHKQEYEQMVEAAKKKEQKDIRQKKKHLQLQLKHEEQLVAAAKTWNSEVLPNWEITKQTKRARELWWCGLPPCVRGKVWKLAIGNELNITDELFEICLNRAKDRIKMLSEESNGSLESSPDLPSSKEASVELIKLDVSRTFPQFCIFQKGGPYHDLLHSLLGAYACYRPDVGYVQGMSFLAAVLLLNMDVADAFICFANLLNGPCQVAFFRVDEGMMKSYFDTYDEFLLENMPQLHQHFGRQNLTPDIYIIDWIFTIFSRSLPLDVACRVWDVFCRDGEEFLFRTALGILHLYQNLLLEMDFIHLAQFLTKLPEDISSDQLFRSVQAIRLSIDKKKFAQVLSGHREARERSDYF
ncbi:TBC1 domain family member 14-like [Argonauta hians]